MTSDNPGWNGCLVHSEDLRVAHLSDRAFAAIIDGILALPVFAMTTALIAYCYRIPRASDGTISLQGGPALLSMTLDLIVWLVYYTVAERGWGGTFGKEMMSIQVRDVNGGACSTRQAALRNLLRPIDAIFFYALGFVVALQSESNQRIGDKLARTIVAEKRSSRRLRAVLLWLFTNALLAVVALYLTHMVSHD